MTAQLDEEIESAQAVVDDLRALINQLYGDLSNADKVVKPPRVACFRLQFMCFIGKPSPRTAFTGWAWI